MIAPMEKVYIVSRLADRDRLVRSLGLLGLVHVLPVEAASAHASKETLEDLDRLNRALQILEPVLPAGIRPQLSPEQASDEVLHLARQMAEGQAKLTSLLRQAEQLAPWGDVTLQQIEQLQAHGLDIHFALVPMEELASVQGDLVHVLRRDHRKHALVAIVTRDGEHHWPPGLRELPLPSRDRPSLRREAAQVDAQLQAHLDRLAQLAHLRDALRNYRAQLRQDAIVSAVTHSGKIQGDLYAVQGWVPQEQLPALRQGLDACGFPVAISTLQPTEDEQPPTHLVPPAWAKPITGLLSMLGTVPGYREFDVTPFFMIALPIFAAMLIGDAGYGLLFLLLPLLRYRKMAAKIGPQVTQLMLVIGAATTLWGITISSYFGVSAADMQAAGGIWTPLGQFLDAIRIVRVDVNIEPASQQFMMRLTFIIAAVHLSTAHLAKAVVLFPSLRFLASVGWAMVLWGMFGVVQHLVVGGDFNWHLPYPYLLIVGGTLAVCFASTRGNPLKNIPLAIANSIFPVIGTFSDTISYVRLMAIGLAGGVLAMSFNNLATSTGSAAAAIPILLVGHSLNVGLTLIALIAHGVRLNLLEFSNNLGMEWSGYAYQPFTIPKES